jgi:hypothetical protein
MIRNDANYHGRRKMNESGPNRYIIEVPEKFEQGENYGLFQDSAVTIKKMKMRVK